MSKLFEQLHRDFKMMSDAGFVWRQTRVDAMLKLLEERKMLIEALEEAQKTLKKAKQSLLKIR